MLPSVRLLPPDLRAYAVTCRRCGLPIRIKRHRFSSGRRADLHFRCKPHDHIPFLLSSRTGVAIWFGHSTAEAN